MGESSLAPAAAGLVVLKLVLEHVLEGEPPSGGVDCGVLISGFSVRGLDAGVSMAEGDARAARRTNLRG